MSEQEFELLAAEFIERHRSGEQPTVDEYAHRFPELADEIRDLFPTMVALERLKEKKQQQTPPKRFAALTIQQLGDYRIVREIGRGGMGIVYEAEQLSLGRRVAVKVLPQQSLLQGKQLDRFQREATTAARLHHTNIVPIFGVGHDDGYHYIVMQYIDGVGLDEITSQLRGWVLNDPQETLGHAFPLDAARSSQASAGARSLLDDQFHARESQRDGMLETVMLSQQDTLVESGPQPPPIQVAAEERLAGPLQQELGEKYWRSVARIGQQAANALTYAHDQGILHRDIKPSNLLLDMDGQLWIADFGLAKANEHDAISRTGDIVGTLAYMAPEQLSGSSDCRSDVYSLGATLYELLTLQPVLTGKSYTEMIRQITEGRIVPPSKRNPETPRDLETIILKALAREPAARYENAAMLAEDLQRFLEDRPVLARRASWVERTWRWTRRNPLAASLGGAVATLMTALVVVLSIAFANTNQKLEAKSVEQNRTQATLEITLEVLDNIYDQIAPDRVAANSWSEDDGSFVATPTTLSPATVRVLNELIAGYERLAETESENVEILARAARARSRVGELQTRLGRLAEAAKTLAAANDQYEALRTVAPNSDAYKSDNYVVQIARIHNARGEVLWRQQDRAGRDEHKAALTLLEKAEDPRNAPTELRTPAARFELARTLYLLGRRLERPANLGEAEAGRPGGRRPDGPPGWDRPPGRARPPHEPNRPRPRGPRPGPPPGGPGQAGPAKQSAPNGELQAPPTTSVTDKSATAYFQQILERALPIGEAQRNEYVLLLLNDEQPPRQGGDFPLPRRGNRGPNGPGRGPGGPGRGAFGPGGPGRGGFGPGGPGSEFNGRPEHGGRPGQPPRDHFPDGHGDMFRPGPRRRHPVENTEFLNRAIRILDALAKEHDNPEVIRLTALCHQELAAAHDSQSMHLAIELFEKLHDERPDVADYAFDLSRAYLEHLPSGSTHPADQELVGIRLAAARELLTSLNQKHPSEAEYAAQLALVILEQTNMLAGAYNELDPLVWRGLRKDLEEAFELQSRVLKHNPSPFQHAALAAIEYRYAETYFGNREFGEAEKVLLKSIARLSEFRETLTQDPHLRLIEQRLDGSRSALRETREALKAAEEERQESPSLEPASLEPASNSQT